MGELTLLGKILIKTESTGNAEVFHVELTAENRDEVIHGDTREGETIDQLILRLKGMLKAMFNAPVKKAIQEKEKERQRQEMMGSVTGVKK